MRGEDCLLDVELARVLLLVTRVSVRGVSLLGVLTSVGDVSLLGVRDRHRLRLVYYRCEPEWLLLHYLNFDSVANV